MNHTDFAYRREFQLNDPRKRVLMRFSVYLCISMIKSAGNKVYFALFKAVLQCPTCTWWLVSPEVSSAAVLVVGLFLSFSVCLGRCRWLAFPCIRVVGFLIHAVVYLWSVQAGEKAGSS